MKFFSLDHLWLVAVAILTTNLLMSEVFFMKYMGVALGVYGLLMINRRIMEMIELLKKVDQKLP